MYQEFVDLFRNECSRINPVESSREIENSFIFLIPYSFLYLSNLNARKHIQFSIDASKKFRIGMFFEF